MIAGDQRPASPPGRTRRRDDRLLTDVLREVSRSFYLTLRVLPASIRPQIGLAYLLARTSDSIADTDAVPLADRVGMLQELSARILQSRAAPSHPLPLPAQAASSPEHQLLQRIPEMLEFLAQFTPADQQAIRQVLKTIITGQLLDLQRFAPHPQFRIAALQSDAELDDYTYHVAGCVGEFWTTLCRRHLFPKAPLDDRQLFSDAVRFGKGLQLVNILRDLPRDLRNGRCYLPSPRLAELGLSPADLTCPTAEGRFRPLFDHYIGLALHDLRCGWHYTLALPFRCVQVRLACAWPILIGVATLKKLKVEPILQPDRVVKVSRPEVRKTLLWSTLLYPFPPLWSRLGPVERRSEP